MWPFRKKTRPDAQDAARRLLVLKHVVAIAVSMPPPDLLQELTAAWSPEQVADFQRHSDKLRRTHWDSLREAGLASELTPREQEFAKATSATLTGQQQIDASWRLESVVVLLWALQLIPELPPYDSQARHEILAEVPSDDLKDFIRSAELRDEAEIDAARDLAELWHWRSRTRLLIESGEPFPDDPRMQEAGFRSYDDIVRRTAGTAAASGQIPAAIDEDFPAFGMAYRDLSDEQWSEVRSITVERHFALNWLCGRAPGHQWDETPTDT